MESADQGGLKIFSTKIVEKIFFQKPLKMRFPVENSYPGDTKRFTLKFFQYFTSIYRQNTTNVLKFYKIQNERGNYSMKQSGLGIASMILGIISILTACIAFGIVPGIVGAFLAIIALCQKDKKHGTAIAGLTCSIIGIIIFAIMALFVNGVSDSSKESTGTQVSVSATQEGSAAVSESTPESKVEEVEVPSDTVISPGYTFDADGLQVTINDFDLDFTDYEDEYGWNAPADGTKYIMIDVSYQNNSKDDKYVSIYDFQCYADDTDCEQNYSVVDNSSLNANISSGRKTSYKVAFVVPQDAQSIELEYETSIWTGNKEIIKLQ